MNGLLFIVYLLQRGHYICLTETNISIDTKYRKNNLVHAFMLVLSITRLALYFKTFPALTFAIAFGPPEN